MITKAELLNQIKTRVATMDKRLMLRQINATLDHAIKTIDAKTEEGDKWITTESGSHILVDGEGNIKGGAGGKFNGKPLNSMGGTKKFTKYETVAEREGKAKPSSERKFVEGKTKEAWGYYEPSEKAKSNLREKMDKIKAEQKAKYGDKKPVSIHPRINDAQNKVNKAKETIKQMEEKGEKSFKIEAMKERLSDYERDLKDTHEAMASGTGQIKGTEEQKQASMQWLKNPSDDWHYIDSSEKTEPQQTASSGQGGAFSHETIKHNLINAVKEHKYGTPAFNKEWKKHESQFSSLSSEQQEDIKNNLRKAIENWKPKHHSGVQSILKQDERIKGTTGMKGATLKDNEVKFLNDIAEKEKLSEKQADWLKSISKKMNINISLPEIKKSKPKSTTQSKALGSYEDADMPEYDEKTKKWYDLETGLEIHSPKNPYAKKSYL